MITSPCLKLFLIAVSLYRALGNYHDHSETYLNMPVKVITMVSEQPKYMEGLRYFLDSFERARGVDIPMELAIIRTTAEQHAVLGWKAKILYALKTLRETPHDQLVIWADSKDVIWLPCGRDLRKAFKKFKHDIVLGSCPFQFPDKYKEELFPDIPLIDHDIPFPSWQANSTYFTEKFINAGVIVGKAGALRHYFGGAFLRYGNGVYQEPGVDQEHFNDQAFWADMYLAQYYDDPFQASTHPTITIDSGYLLAAQAPETYIPVGSTGYWQSDRSRYTACLIHAPGGPSNFNVLREAYTKTWSKSFDVSGVKSL
ncbi:hypothetical protein CVIRNUC_009972 [Coccomyxa viridis]|uniref:Uncharacterized protein n=1 Tax=Coccomyxa viridis TaxID=1274662 RepID=A0AAV1IHI9_9CHLO|nr:hypothetical protein CVIRNUC_009972 [Coccomyxa viridis]